jgi:hypothetical protein
VTWPQVVVAALIVFAVVAHAVGLVKNKDKSSERVTLEIFLHVALYAAYAGVLAAGGFW